MFCFSATVGNLQSKVESLTTTNALMKEDLAIARNSLLALQAENLALRRTAQQGNNDGRNDNPNNVLDHIDPEMAQALTTEKKKRLDIERELELQVRMISLRFFHSNGHRFQTGFVCLFLFCFV